MLAPSNEQATLTPEKQIQIQISFQVEVCQIIYDEAVDIII